MSQQPLPHLVFASNDRGLIAHWNDALGKGLHIADWLALRALSSSDDCIIWLDFALADLPPWSSPQWHALIHPTGAGSRRLVIASSNPLDDQAIAALEAGAVGYCHAFSDAESLRKVQQVIQAGHVWIGKNLMQKLLSGVTQAVNKAHLPTNEMSMTRWDAGLTQREREVADLAAHGASNQSIADQCAISERTVKAHLSAVFEKLQVADRLQLALKVHGIQ